MPASDQTERIAIVGVGGIFPGAPDLDTFWKNVAGGVDCGRHVPDGRWYLSPKQAYAPWPPQPDRVYSTWGCFIEGFQFDPEGLNLDRSLLERLDPMFHLGLHAARAAFRDAKQLDGVDHARVGVILGNIALPTESTSAICRDVLGRTFVEKLIDATPLPIERRAELKAALKRSDWHPLNRFAAGLPSSLIAQGLGLGGTAFTLDAACASSLYALKFASEELLAHRADAMLAGGMSRPDCQYTQMGFAQLQALSKSGRCAPLSGEADGLVVGEGAGVFVLKRLSDAVAAGDHIYGVIAGIGLSNDRGANLLAPHSEGQLRAMRSAYEQAGWQPSDVDLIECHATGTPVGDAVEIESLHQLWQHENARPQQCVIGGVKSNVGHLLTGAGAAGLMKVLFALKHRTLPPTANYRQPATRMAAVDSPFRVLAEAQPWERRDNDTPRRATINAFGFGGINAHVLIEEWNSSNANHSSVRRGATDGWYPDHQTCPITIVGQSAIEGDATVSASGMRAITEVRMPMGQFRIPPLEMQDMLPQQQLMLKVADDALRDAESPPLNLQPSTLDPSRTGVFIGTELDPNTTNFHLRWSIEQDAPRWAAMLGLDLTPDELTEWTKQLKDAAGPPLTPNRVMGNLGGIVASRLAREFDVGGPSFTISAGGDGGGVAFQVAVGMLQRGELDRALVGAVDLPCDIRCLVGATESEPQDGVIAFVLTRLEDAHRTGTRVHAVFERDANPENCRPTGLAPVESGLCTTHCHTPANQADCRNEDRTSSAETELHRDKPSGGVRGRLQLNSFRSEAATASARELWQDATNALGPQSRGSAGWRTPLGKTGRVAFVFPGSGNAFLGMGRELLAAFPDVLRCQEAENQRLRDQYRPDLFWEGRSNVELLANHKAMIFGQVAIGTAVCDLLALFGVKPSASIGYSLGESAALFGLRAWTDRDEMLRRMEESPLFGSDLVAPFDAARKAWGVPDGQSVEWVSGVIDRSADAVRAVIGNVGWDQRRFAAPAHQNVVATPDGGPALEASLPHPTTDTPPRVYLLIVNTPTQCVIGGERSAVEQLVRDLAATFVPFAAPSTVHCEVLRAVEGRYRELHLMRTVMPMAESQAVSSAERRDYGSPVAPPTGREVTNGMSPSASALSTPHSALDTPIDFYSTAWGHKYDLNRESAAEAIVAQAVGTIDFPRVIEQAYADGVRVFVEIGPGSSCTKMIGEILGDRPHLARAALPNTSRPVETFLEVLATLIAEGVPVDLSYLYGESVQRSVFSVQEEAVRQRESRAEKPVIREIVTRVGGLPFEIPAPPGGWKFRETVVEPTSFNRVGNAPRECGCEADDDAPSIEPVCDLNHIDTPHGALPTRLNEDAPDIHPSPIVTPQRPVLTLHAQPSTLNLFNQLQLMTDHRTQAHDTFLRFSARAERLAAQHLAVLAQSAGATDQTDTAAQWSSTPNLVPSSPSSGERARVRGPSGENASVTAFPTEARTPHPNPLPTTEAAVPEARGEGTGEEALAHPRLTQRTTPPRSLNRDECLTFAIGRIGDCLGTMFADIDQHSTRVRLPDVPLMLVDRILTIEGEPLSMTSGRVVTEHDIHPGAWYLDCDRIPTCIAVESGQADLFLSGWLGIDFETKGLASYRLLDAVVTFHDELPQAGKTINYDIRVLHFFRQGETYLFRFEFDATVDGRPLLTMREGCAGFFTQAELAGGKGIIHTALDKRPRPGKQPADWSDPVPMAVESYDDSQLLALRQGDFATCFGPAFVGLPLREPVTIPGLREVTSDEWRVASVRAASPANASSSLPLTTHHSPLTTSRSRMWLIDRVLKLDPVGGKFGIGTILGELDIHPDDWFLTCHFCDDQVMPGTLMYECCMHTLRIFLLRMGWVGEAGQIAYEPIIEVRSRLKCRGQVLSSTKKVWYEVTLKEIGYGPDAYCMADALMYADGKPIVEITDMSVRLTGLSREKVTRLWSSSGPLAPALRGEGWGEGSSSSISHPQKMVSHAAAAKPLTLALSPQSRGEGTTVAAPREQEVQTTARRSSSPSFNPQPSALNPAYDFRPAIFDTDRITAFAIGKPSDAFGDKYRVFDAERKIARLPGPPFQFLDRVVSIENCQPWKLEAGGEIVAQYDIPVEAWYFAANRQPTMPFAVLLETALQPCGWLAGYLGSALTSETDLSFRNLGGKATQFREVTPQSGTLTTKVKITKVSQSGGMIIQNFDYHLSCNGEPVYVGDTYFGFFSKESLAHQVGIRDAKVFVPSADESARARRFDAPDAAPFSNSDYMMVDNAELLLDGGPLGLGFARGTMQVDPSTWFFKAHFYEDPVVPGSLGLESFFQLLKFYAAARWRLGTDARFHTPSQRLDAKTSKPVPHEWVYRGQVVPRDELVTVTAVITAIDDSARQLTAEGFLSVDGRVIYQMKSFTMGVT